MRRSKAINDKTCLQISGLDPWLKRADSSRCLWDFIVSDLWGVTDRNWDVTVMIMPTCSVLTQMIEADLGGVFGQLKEDTNITVVRLQEVVGRIKEASEAINIASKEIQVGNQDLSSRTEQPASGLEETASSMEELNATVRQNADNGRQANALAASSNEIAHRGGERVKRVVSTMGDIQDSSRKIVDIIGVIDSIAFQTNLGLGCGG